MSKVEFLIADPYNQNHIDLYKKFEQDNNLSNNESIYLETIKNTYQQDLYKEELKKRNEISILGFALLEKKIIDTCTIKIEKDRKIAYVAYPKRKIKKRKIISLSTNYIFSVLGIEEIFASAGKDDAILINDLEENLFESLGEFDNNIKFVKEKEYEIINERKSSCK